MMKLSILLTIALALVVAGREDEGDGGYPMMGDMRNQGPPVRRLDCQLFCKKTGFSGYVGGCHCGFTLFSQKRGLMEPYRSDHQISAYHVPVFRPWPLGLVMQQQREGPGAASAPDASREVVQAFLNNPRH